MTFKQLKTKLKIKTELYKHYSELYHLAVGELKFERLQTDHLQTVLGEVQELAEQGVSQKLIAKVIENGIERRNLDKLIHTDLIFK